MTTAVELDCDVIGANYWRCLGTRLVSRAKAVGLEVHAWTVERPLTAMLLGLRELTASLRIGRSTFTSG